MEGHLSDDYVVDKNGAWGSKSAALDWYRRELDAKQAKIDELMLEYCPDEMTEKQLVEWAKHQRVVYDGRLKMKVLDVIWFSGTSCVGIVKTESEYDGVKYYISSATGMDEKVDTEHIAAWGATFPSDVGEMLFARYGINIT